ncbi:MAG: GspH/FimT family pseudopilin [Dyella sp.]
MTQRLRRCRGFTLTELLVTVAVASILAMIAVPSFLTLMRRQRVAGSYNSLVASLQYARTEAINRGAYVAVCPTTSTTKNAATCSGSTSYETGWLVYSYPVSLGTNLSYDATKAQLLRLTSTQAAVSIRAADGNVITFGQQGQVQPLNATSAHNVQFAVCALANGTSGLGQNTSSVPGALLTLSGSGGIKNTQLSSGAACTP